MATKHYQRTLTVHVMLGAQIKITCRNDCTIDFSGLKVTQATSRETKLPEHAVSMVILWLYQWLIPASGLQYAPWPFDIQKMTDTVAKNGSSYANGNRGDSIFGVSCLHIRIV